MKLRLSFFVLLFVSLSANVSSAQSSNTQNKIDRLLLSSEFDYASISISVLDMETGDLVARVNPNMSIIPASSLKILTTLSALEILSDTFQYTTTLSYDGYIENDGTLQGNVYLEGNGDPTFGSERFKPEMAYQKLFKRLAEAIEEEGITCIDGQVIADESQFNSFPISPSWQWNDLGNYYATGAWGININENQYNIYFNKRGVVGRRPKVNYHDPFIPGLKFSNELEVDSAHTGDQAYIFGGPYNYEKRIVGTIPQGDGNFRIGGSIPDPPMFAAYTLNEALRKKEIKTEGYDTAFSAPGKSKRKAIVKVSSPYLRDISRRANFKSNNLYCEAILKSMGKKYHGEASGQNGIAAIINMLKKLKIDSKALHMEDGAGLSARNNVSSNLLAEFLQKMAIKKGTDYLCDQLPKAGYEGTVAGLLKVSPARGKVWMKSGSMNRVCTYTGIMQDQEGRWKTFCIMINGYDVKYKVMRARVEKMVDYIYRYN